MYVLLWQTVSALTRVYNPLVSTETVRHSSTYIILYLINVHLVKMVAKLQMIILSAIFLMDIG